MSDEIPNGTEVDPATIPAQPEATEPSPNSNTTSTIETPSVDVSAPEPTADAAVTPTPLINHPAFSEEQRQTYYEILKSDIKAAEAWLEKEWDKITGEKEQ